MAFKDNAPQMPIHIILIPKIHLAGLNELTDDSAMIIAHIVMKAKMLAKKFDIEASGYRLVSNCGSDARQSINHLHFHLLGGAVMRSDLA
jgi:histidine triad (HIT) family protein